MASIFPGMDPYLENPHVWHGFHNAFVVYLTEALQPALGPRYIAAVEVRIYLERPGRDAIPDVAVRRTRRRDRDRPGGVAVIEADAPRRVQVPSLEIHESYATILDRSSGLRVVAVIEVVSPSNKYAGPGRDSYLAKQAEVLASDVHLIEIDLLRTGPHVLAVPEHAARAEGPYATLVCVNRAEPLRDVYELYPRCLRERLPRIGVPLADGDPDVVVDIQTVLAKSYDAGRYAERIDYRSPCKPALDPADQAWADGVIGEKMFTTEDTEITEKKAEP